MKPFLPIVITIGFSVVGVLGDYLLKLASDQKNPLRSGWFYVGFAVYASTAFGWVYVMRHLKLATIGVVYSVSMILLLAGPGTLVFREPLRGQEVVGLDPGRCLTCLADAVRLIDRPAPRLTEGAGFRGCSGGFRRVSVRIRRFRR